MKTNVRVMVGVLVSLVSGLAQADCTNFSGLYKKENGLFVKIDQTDCTMATYSDSFTSTGPWQPEIHFDAEFHRFDSFDYGNHNGVHEWTHQFNSLLPDHLASYGYSYSEGIAYGSPVLIGNHSVQTYKKDQDGNVLIEYTSYTKADVVDLTLSEKLIRITQ